MKETFSPIFTSSVRSPLHDNAFAPFDYQPLGRVVVEAGGMNRLGELARSLGGLRVLMVTDPGLEHVGHPQRAVASLREAGLYVTTFDGVKENPTDVEVQNGV